MPSGQVLLEDFEQVVVDLDRDVVGAQRGVQAGIIAPRPHVEDVLLHLGDECGCKGVLEREITIGVVLPGTATRIPVRVGDQPAYAGLTDLDAFAAGGHGRLE